MGFLWRMCGVAGLALGLGACAGAAPFSRLEDGDRALLAAARQKALETSKTGEAVNWSNPDTGRRGSVMPTRTYKGRGGADCREFQQTATVGGETDIAFGSACRAEDGSWRVVKAPSPYYPDYPDYYAGYDHRFGYGAYYGFPPYPYPHWRHYGY